MFNKEVVIDAFRTIYDEYSDRFPEQMDTSKTKEFKSSESDFILSFGDWDLSPTKDGPYMYLSIKREAIKVELHSAVFSGNVKGALSLVRIFPRYLEDGYFDYESANYDEWKELFRVVAEDFSSKFTGIYSEITSACLERVAGFNCYNFRISLEDNGLIANEIMIYLEMEWDKHTTVESLLFSDIKPELLEKYAKPSWKEIRMIESADPEYDLHRLLVHGVKYQKS